MNQKLLKARIELLERVNSAKTEAEHNLLMAELNGFDSVCMILEVYLGVESDRYYLNQGIDRPMVAGKFIDWTATE